MHIALKIVAFLLIFSVVTTPTKAQNSYKDQTSYKDGLRWCVDVNVHGGYVLQSVTSANNGANYLNALNINTENLKCVNVVSSGLDIQLGYFFNHKKTIGIGTGVIYTTQQGDIILDSFHIEYQSKDYQERIFRQQTTSTHPVNEAIQTVAINMPLFLKYNKRLSKKVGIIADIGILYGIKSQSTYSTDASFDYEAIYQYERGPDGIYTAVYDNSPIPSTTKDWYITKMQYMASNPTGMVRGFDSLNYQGYNVGIGVVPKKNNGTVSYTSNSVGMLIRPQLGIYVSEKVVVNIGGYCMYQQIKNPVGTNYYLTDKVGDYSSVLNSIATSVNLSYGANIGIRYRFGKMKDSDGDGVPDKRDNCPKIAGLAKFKGCPDTDGDGIPDKDDVYPFNAGLVKFQGCPDSDKDDVPDNIDSCPHQKGLISLHGCPDKDGDGVQDNKDVCTDLFGVSENYGCPTDFSENFVQFQKGKSTILKTSYPLLDSVAAILKKYPKADILLEGVADKKTKPIAGKGIAGSRLEEIKKYLLNKGIGADRLVTGSADNKVPSQNTAAKNKNLKKNRALIRLKYRVN